MVEINNQRKAFLDMLAWSEGTDNGRQKTRNHGYDVIVGGELFTDFYPITSQTCHAKPKTQINRRRTLPASFPVGGMPTASSLAWKTFSESQDAVALQQIKERGALPMIDRGDIRQAIDRCSNIWASLPGLVMVSSSIRLTAWLQNSKKRAERSERLMYEQSHRDYLLLWLSASSSACHGLLIITVITPLPTKPSATKMPENWSWRTRQLLTCRCVSVMLLRSMQNTRRS